MRIKIRKGGQIENAPRTKRIKIYRRSSAVDQSHNNVIPISFYLEKSKVANH